MVEAIRHLWRSSSPIPLLKQGHLELLTQDSVQTFFNISKDGYSTIPLGNLCNFSVIATVKKCFSMLR